MKRESGFYWVCLDNEFIDWTIGVYYSNIDEWEVLGWKDSLKDNQFYEIDENRIKRAEDEISFDDPDGEVVEQFTQCNKCGLTGDHSIECPNS